MFRKSLQVVPAFPHEFTISCRHTGESGMLAWVHSTLEESVETMEGLHDGAIFSRLLDRLFQSSFPLEKVALICFCYPDESFQDK